MSSALILLALVGSTLAGFPVSDNNNCRNNQKFVDKAGSRFIKLCKEATYFGETIRQSQVVACLAYDDVTEIPLGSTWDNYQGSKLQGYRIACKKTANGGVTLAPESCLMGQPAKVVPFGGKSVVGQHVCTCVNSPGYRIKCEPINLFGN